MADDLSRIAIDLAQAAAHDAMEAVLRKAKLEPSIGALVVTIACTAIEAKARSVRFAMRQHLPPSLMDDLDRMVDEMVPAEVAAFESLQTKVREARRG